MTDTLIDSPPLDLSDLPDMEAPPPADQVPEGTPCPVCGEPVPKLPGQKRRRKYHDACKPGSSSSESTGSSSSTTRTPRGSVKAEREADEAIAWFRQQLVRGCLMLSVVDRYDAFVVMVNVPELCETLKGVLLRYPRFRAEFRAMKQGGSLIGLAFLVVLIAAPIAAHHGLIPHKKTTEILVRLPFILYDLAQKLREGEAGLEEMMREMHANAKRKPAPKTEGGEPSANGSNANANEEYLSGSVV